MNKKADILKILNRITPELRNELDIFIDDLDDGDILKIEMLKLITFEEAADKIINLFKK